MKGRSFFKTIALMALIAILSGIVYVTWKVKQEGLAGLKDAARLLPVSQNQKDALSTLISLGDFMFAEDDRERVFLVLFQNNWELRPGGGFIGSFGVVKVRNGNITHLEIHDTGNFDGRIPSTVAPPYPMRETLRIDSWKFRDSNFSPDFPTNAKKAEEFYYMGQGSETFDGIIGITANVLTSMLEVTGPITLAGYPGTYSKEDAIYTLEYQVEKGYVEQGISKGERKSVMRDLAKAIMDKLGPLNVAKKIQLGQIALDRLKSKDIQLYFANPALQKVVQQQGWGGTVDQSWQGDYLMMVDANLGAYKSDYFMKREFAYTVDLSKETPTATLSITYHHTAPKRDWLVNHYKTFLRVYTPAQSWLTDRQNLGEPTFSSEFNKTSFGFLVDVTVTEQKIVTMTYQLPQSVVQDYKLKIQKQPGVTNVPGKVTLIDPSGTKSERTLTLNEDTILEF